jgi:cytosine/adenosine deaminase-related metal-dependent hydrolase
MPLTLGYSVEEAFNLATIRGAHAVKMGDKIGSIAEGKLADLVIFDANSPSMICGGAHNPVAAVILHSSPADVDTVIVDGIVRKQNGRLLDIQLDDTGKKAAGQDRLAWKDVATNLLRTRQRINQEAEKIDFKDGEKKVMEAFHMDPSELQDP